MINDRGQIESKILVPISIIIIMTAMGGFLITQVSLTVTVLIIVLFITLTTGFLNPEISLYLLLIAMLLSPEFIVGDLMGRGTGARGVTVRLDDFLIVIIGLGWFLRTAIDKELGLFLRTLLNTPIAIYITACLASTLIGFMSGRLKLLTGIFFILKYFEYFVIYFMAVNYLREKKQVERFVAVILGVCFVICIIAILQIPAGGRVTAPFEGEVGEPNTLGGYLVLMLSIATGLLVMPQSTEHKKYLGVLIALIIVSLLATLSRSSWLAAFPMVLTLIYFSPRKTLLIISLLVVILISPFALPKAVKERALYTVAQRYHAEQIEVGGVRIDTSTSARLYSWKDALTKDFIKHPILGYGITGYKFLDAQYPRMLVETGVVGFISFFILLFSVYRNALHNYRTTTDPFFSGIILGYLAGFVGMILHAIGTNTFIIVRIMEPFWFLTAIVIMIPKIEAGDVKIKEAPAKG
ncbi:MAG: O-antigen ligase family protein [Deltaproteobacteria bacterium]|nr:O-antigen ligase family protein [Deltaproteobacteria bacterium]MBN2686872.1 O-antigen ligase family protein [Deltaproteobacteria bacterium]